MADTIVEAETLTLTGTQEAAGAFDLRSGSVMTLTLLLSDIVCLSVAAVLAIMLRAAIARVITIVPLPGDILLSAQSGTGQYLQVVSTILALLVVYALRGLYPAIGMGAVDELRLLSISTTAVVLSISTATYFLRLAPEFSRLVLLFAWLLALGLVPFGRRLARKLGAGTPGWGEPVAIIGYGEKGLAIREFLQQNPALGLRPVVAIDGIKREALVHEATVTTIPVLGRAALLSNSQFAGLRVGILVDGEVEAGFIRNLLDRGQLPFRRIILVGSTHEFGNLWVRSLDLGGWLAMDVRQNLLNPWQQRMKRAMDLSVVLFGLIVLIPLHGFISLLVLLESGWPIFFRQSRIGRNGQTIDVLKFRTMHRTADEMLVRSLREDPELRAEWETKHKLCDDPRVTRVGRWLRHTSLDELPQVWNVLKGEMSLVGPRPIVEAEAHRYGERLHLYKRVRPGITGLWQVSGRNDISYAQRVALDEYYVRNWSVWLDLYIMAKTPWVMLTRRGAY